ncbi:MAG TPA: hypothetical protein VH188_14130 [Chthoniobacterales bacterium]|jgi:hypothetical protein|nr:hypothetical protein [Chthoniobacterales bacterium]
MIIRILFPAFVLVAATAHAQIQVDLSFKRLQYIAHEPILATIKIANNSGRDIDLRDDNGQRWFGFEINAGESRLLAPLKADATEPALHVEAGKTVIRKINLTALYPVHDFGAYHIRANVYFTDLNKFFYSATKVVQVTDARPIWQKTVGVPDGMPGAGEARTYSLLSNRFVDHTSLYVRVENRDTGAVFTTYSLGRIIASGDPQAEVDRANQLHVLHCAAPRSWAYSHVGLNGELLAHSTFLETKTRPHLRHTPDGSIAVNGGKLDVPIAESKQSPTPKLSERPPASPAEE